MQTHVTVECGQILELLLTHRTLDVVGLLLGELLLQEGERLLIAVHLADQLLQKCALRFVVQVQLTRVQDLLHGVRQVQLAGLVAAGRRCVLNTAALAVLHGVQDAR